MRRAARRRADRSVARTRGPGRARGGVREGVLHRRRAGAAGRAEARARARRLRRAVERAVDRQHHLQPDRLDVDPGGEPRGRAGADAEQPAWCAARLGVHAALAVSVAAGFFVLAPLIGAAGRRAAHRAGAADPERRDAALRPVHAAGRRAQRPEALRAPGGARHARRDAAHDRAGLRRLLAGAAGGRGVEGAALGFVRERRCRARRGARVWSASASAAPGVRPCAQHLAFIAPLLFGQVVLNLLLQADLTLLRASPPRPRSARGCALEAADPLVGAYRATQLFCFLPYQLL